MMVLDIIRWLTTHGVEPWHLMLVGIILMGIGSLLTQR